eukprot:1147699-Pelagomonas_calceolata.AAC.1
MALRGDGRWCAGAFSGATDAGGCARTNSLKPKLRSIKAHIHTHLALLRGCHTEQGDDQDEPHDQGCYKDVRVLAVAQQLALANLDGRLCMHAYVCLHMEGGWLKSTIKGPCRLFP